MTIHVATPQNIYVQLAQWVRKNHIKGPAKAVLMALAYHSNNRGECWPSVAVLASVSGRSPRTVFRSLKELEGLGLIERKRRFTKKHGNVSNWYKLQLNAIVTPPLCQDGSTPYDTVAHEVTNSEVTNEEDSEAEVFQPPPKPEGGFSMKKTKTAEEVLVKHNLTDTGGFTLTHKEAVAKCKVSPHTKRVTAKSLAGLWRDLHRIYYSTGFQKALSHKEIAQLKYLSVQWGEAAPFLLGEVIKNWAAFTSRVQLYKDEHSAPLRPLLGYVVLNSDIAAELFGKTQTKPVQLIAPPVLTNHTTKPQAVDEPKEKVGGWSDEQEEALQNLLKLVGE